MLRCVVAVLVVGICFEAARADVDVAVDTECVARVERFLQKRFPRFVEGAQPTGNQTYLADDFLFFLHVPRTAGRSFWSCFLYRAFPPSKKCVKSYDSLRLELSRPDCKLLASHDDYSITDFFPSSFKVITQVRDPVDRVVSVYEFAATNAAKDFSPNVTKANADETKVKTRDVWPWLYLVQLFDRYFERSMGLLFKKQALYEKKFPKEYEESLDMWVQSISRNSGRTYYYHRKTRESKWELTEEEKARVLPMLDPYNNSLIIPLDLFVEFPMAEDLVNNAMTFQLLGLSNTSYWEEAAEIRACATHCRAAQAKLLEAAKWQLDSMLHVSLTHKLDESLQSIAATLKLGLTGPTWGGVASSLSKESAEVQETELEIEKCRNNLTQLEDRELLQLLFKYRFELDEIRDVARSRRRSQLTKQDFLPKWDRAVANLEHVREIQAEVMKRRKEKGEQFVQYPNSTSDEGKLLKLGLWENYVKCVNLSASKNRASKLRSMSNVAYPDERRPYFTKKARQNIPQSTIDVIKEKNRMDVELYEYALELYDAQLERQRERGLLEEFPKIEKNQTKQSAPPSPPKPVVHEEL